MTHPTKPPCAKNVTGLVFPSMNLSVTCDDAGVHVLRMDGKPMGKEFAHAIMVKMGECMDHTHCVNRWEEGFNDGLRWQRPWYRRLLG